MDFLSSNSSLMMEKSMGFLWTKQAAILDNITNAETPGYRTKVVTFEESFQDSLEKAQKSGLPKQTRQVIENAEYAVKEHPGITRMDDNGVNVAEQQIEMVRNAYQLQYVMSAINSELSVLRTAVSGQ